MTNKKMQNITKADLTNKPVCKALDPKAEAEKMAKDITSMKEKADEKVERAIEHLHKQVESASKKYLTVTGIEAAMDYGEKYFDGLPMFERLHICQQVAQTMSKVATRVVGMIDERDEEGLADIPEELYNPEFAMQENLTPHDVVLQIMLLDLCRNVGNAADDIVGFRKSSGEEIKKAEDELAAFKAEHSIED